MSKKHIRRRIVHLWRQLLQKVLQVVIDILHHAAIQLRKLVKRDRIRRRRNVIARHPLTGISRQYHCDKRHECVCIGTRHFNHGPAVLRLVQRRW